MNHSLIGRVGISKKQLVIGLDFGAAFSKVVIGDRLVRYAVPFGEFAHPTNPYLLPSLINVDKNNHCSLTSADKAFDTGENLKSLLLDKNCSDDECARIVAYLALVFRESKSWLLKRYEKRYGASDLNWSINASLPADSLQPQQVERYKQILYSAWSLSVLPGPISLNRVAQFLDIDETAFDAFPALYKSRLLAKNQINIFSSCNAQICGYAHSKKCQSDLHMLVDVGATNISIATFMVTHENENTKGNRCTLYACSSETVGVSHLLKRRYENLQLPETGINLFKDIPDNQTFAQAHDLTEKDIKFADTLYSGDAAKLISRVMDLTKKQYCTDSTHWDNGVLTFTYGGGARLEIVQCILNRFEKKLPPHRITPIKLTAPDDLMVEHLAKDSYDRLSIAYGLSFVPDDIASVSTDESVGSREAVTET